MSDKQIIRTGLTHFFYSKKELVQFLRDCPARMVLYTDHTVHYLIIEQGAPIAGVWGKSADLFFVTVFNKIG